MLFRQPQWAEIAAGRLRVSFRNWKRPQVRVGGRYKTPVGALVVDALERVPLASVTDRDAASAGFASLAALHEMLGIPPPVEVFRVEFHIEPANEEPAPPRAVDEVLVRLDRLDRASRSGSWTAVVLGLIAERPATRAADLAAHLGRERLPFKADVRKLKALGLTESLDVGYRLTPFGRDVLRRLGGRLSR